MPTTSADPANTWSQWFQPPPTAPKKSRILATRAVPTVSILKPSIDESPPKELPDLVYNSPGDPASPSGSSSSHDLQIQFAVRESVSHSPPKARTSTSTGYSPPPTPSDTSHQSFHVMTSSATLNAKKRAPNKLRKPPPSAYYTRHSTLSFIPDQPLPPNSNFPYSLNPPVRASSSSSRISFSTPTPSTRWVSRRRSNPRDVFLHRSLSTPSLTTSPTRGQSPFSPSEQPFQSSSLSSHLPSLPTRHVSDAGTTTIRRGKTMPSAPTRKLVKSRHPRVSIIDTSLPFAALADALDDAASAATHVEGSSQARFFPEGPLMRSPELESVDSLETSNALPNPPSHLKKSLSFHLKRWKSHGSRTRPPAPAPLPGLDVEAPSRSALEIQPSPSLNELKLNGEAVNHRQPALWLTVAQSLNPHLDASPSLNHDSLPTAASQRSSTPPPTPPPKDYPVTFARTDSPSPNRFLVTSNHSHSRSRSIDSQRKLAGVGIPGKTKKMIFTLGDPEDDEHAIPSTGVCDMSSSPEDGVPFPARPPLVRRSAQAPSNTTVEIRTPLVESRASRERRRRWTLAVAMTDDGLTDEVFVEEMEKMWKGWDGSDRNGTLHRNDDETDEDEDSGELSGLRSDTERKNSSQEDSLGHHISVSSPSPSIDRHKVSAGIRESAWSSALRALLTTRDLLRTERNYLRSLQVLLRSCPHQLPENHKDTLADVPANGWPAPSSSNGTGPFTLPWPPQPPPTVMVVYLLTLIRVSSVLLKRMQDDPSVWGVAMAFVLNEEEVEAAFVPWCESVGLWYVDSRDDRERERTPSVAARTPRRLSRARFSSANMAGASSNEVSPVTGEVREKEVDGESKPDTPSPPVHTHPPVVSVSPTTLDLSPSSVMSNATTWRRSLPSLPSLNVSPADLTGMPYVPSPTFFGSRKKNKEHRAKVLSIRELGILPVQRVTRYGLLFRDLLKLTPPTSPTRALVERAVEAAARIANRCNQVQRTQTFSAPLRSL